MKKFLLVFSLLFILISCSNDKNTTKIISIDEDLYVKGISIKNNYIGHSLSSKYRVYYVGPLMRPDTIFIIKGKLINSSIKIDTVPLEYNLGDVINIRKE